MAEVLVTGAAGTVGTALWKGLAGIHSLRGIDRTPSRDRDIRRADTRRLGRIESAFRDVDVVVDLAAHTGMNAEWSDVSKHNLPATMAALEAARRQGVGRYVFASSNHVTGMYERNHPYSAIVAGAYEGLDPTAIPLLGSRCPIRPDGPYAIGKAVGEAAARYYADAFGLSAICLRLGTVNRSDRPTQARHFATFLSHSDLVHLVDCAVRAPSDLRFGTYYGVSDNTWRFWDIVEAREAIGYTPQDDAERFRVSGEQPLG